MADDKPIIQDEWIAYYQNMKGLDIKMGESFRELHQAYRKAVEQGVIDPNEGARFLHELLVEIPRKAFSRPYVPLSEFMDKNPEAFRELDKYVSRLLGIKNIDSSDDEITTYLEEVKKL